jgi:transitional endoplasmic reticulum ATPase
MVLVGKPDEASRLAILKVHSKKMPLEGVDLEDIASRTDGYVGADLYALCREAAIKAYREDRNAQKDRCKTFR